MFSGEAAEAGAAAEEGADGEDDEGQTEAGGRAKAVSFLSLLLHLILDFGLVKVRSKGNVMHCELKTVWSQQSKTRKGSERFLID